MKFRYKAMLGVGVLVVAAGFAQAIHLPERLMLRAEQYAWNKFAEHRIFTARERKRTVVSPDNVYKLKVRRYDMAWEPGVKNKTERDTKRYEEFTEISADDTVVLLMDVYETPNAGHNARAAKVTREAINPLVKIARAAGIKILHMPNNHPIAYGMDVQPEDEQPTDLKRLLWYLHENNIVNIIYAGFATNLCVLNRPMGMINLNRLGYNVILARDATTAFETAETVDDEGLKKHAIMMVEVYYGSTTTVDDLARATATVRNKLLSQQERDTNGKS